MTKNLEPLLHFPAALRRTWATGTALVVCAVGLHAADYQFDTFTAPGGAGVFGLNHAGTSVGTIGTNGFLRDAAGSLTILTNGSLPVKAFGISSSGLVTGFFDEGGARKIFIRDTNGSYTVVAAPDASWNFPLTIDDATNLLGTYVTAGAQRGFIRTPSGAIADIAVAGATNTYAYAFNAHGTIVGSFDDTNGQHGFVQETNGTVSVLSIPGANAVFPRAINDYGVIAGIFFDDTPGAKGFIRYPHGTVVKVLAPEATWTWIFGLNNSGQIAGRIRKNGVTHAFVADLPPLPRFTFETFDVPGATETLLVDISNSGTVVGRYKDQNGLSQGLVADGTNITTVNVTGTTISFVTGINSRGELAGFYRNATNPAIQHAFVRDTNGVFMTIDGPGQNFTYGWRINDAGQMNGYCFENNPFLIRSFRRHTNGALDVFAFPGSPFGTATRGMNDAGTLAGWKWTPGIKLQGVIIHGTNFSEIFTVPGWEHTLPSDINNFGETAGTVNNGFTNAAGFFRRADGTVSIFMPPGATQVEVFGLNDSGVVVGEYIDGAGRRHGFIGRPATGLERGHTDVGLAYEEGELEFHIHSEETETEYSTDEAVLIVRSAAEQPIPDTAAFSFLGEPGYSTWILPSVENEELLFLGFGAEEIETGVFANDQVRVEVMSVEGGDFFLYSVAALGSPVVHMNSADGISASDFFMVNAGSHEDLNWAFSQPGTYRIGLRARGTLVEGSQNITSAVFYVTFEVPAAQLPQPPVPEPELVFNVVDLGTLGGPASFALDLNESRQVTGNARYTSTNSRLHGFLWSDGTMTDIGYLTNGVEFSRGYAINDAGFVVGESDNNVSKAFLWDGTNMVSIGTLGGSSAVAHDINNAGEIVGASSNGSASRPYKRSAAGVFSDLGTLLGTTNSSGRAWAINESGVVVGLSRNEANITSQATLWSGGSISNLGSLNGGTNFSQAYAINDSNVVVGSSVIGKVSPSSSTDLYRAFVWSNGVMADLGAHPWNSNYIHSEAKDVNNAGEIVGYAARIYNSPTSGGAAMLWRDGVAHDLNELVPAGSGWVFQSAEGINDRGDIVGYGSYQGQTRAFLLVRATRLVRGHTDVGVLFEDGELEIEVHSGALDEEFAPVEAVLTVPALAQTSVPTNSDYAFLGAPGAPVWVIPGVQNPKLLFLGLAAEEVAQGLFVNDELHFALKGVEGPGHFALYSIDGFGVPQVRMNSGDGITVADRRTIPASSHEDLYWAFTAPGVYRVKLQASGTLIAGNQLVETDEIDVYFEVIAASSTLAVSRINPNEMRVSLSTQEGLVYQLQSSPTLGPDAVWSDVGTTFIGTGRSKEITVPTLGGAAFFRLIRGN
jgi:surface-anchored protein